MNKRKKILISVAAVVIAIMLACTAYLTTYYEANITDAAFLSVKYTENRIRPHRLDKHIVLSPDEAKTGIIFYPGGKVEADSYIPLMTACADKNLFCVIAEMPFNLAVFDIKAAERLIEMYPDIENWYIAGHSLGGSMAASYAAENSDTFEGLILLGSYSTADLSEADTDVLSIYGSKDGIMNKEKYEECKANLPDSFSEFIIDGGNHAFFGVYGKQNSDGEATIENEDQIIITAEKISEFIEN